MLEFKTVEEVVVDAEVEVNDQRNSIQKMFCDFNKTTGELEPLPVYTETRSEYKHLHNCIPLLLNYKASDQDYSGPLKGKNVLVIGGRRKSRAGTGVEFILDLEHADEFSSLVKKVAQAAREYLEEK